MSRVFLSVAVSEALLLISTAVLGLLHDHETMRRSHVALAVFSILLACLINVGSFTYLIVVSKLIHQAVALGRLDLAPFEESRNAKRRMARLLGVATLTLVPAIATGAWRLGGPEDSNWHMIAGFAALLVQLSVFHLQYGLIVESQARLADVMELYRAARKVRTTRDSGRTRFDVRGTSTGEPPADAPDPARILDEGAVS